MQSKCTIKDGIGDGKECLKHIKSSTGPVKPSGDSKGGKVATLFSYLRLTLFLGGVLIGVQVPMFVDQYGKSLESHFLESERSLHEFKDEAQKHFGGSMEKLIAHYKKSGDPVFHDGGKSIQAIYGRNLELKEAIGLFRKGSWNAYTQAFLAPIPDVQNEVLKNYTYSVKLDFDAIFFGLVSGLFLSGLIESICHVAIAAVSSLKRLLPAS